MTYILLFSFVAFSFVTEGSVGDGEYVMHVLLLRCCQCWYGTNRVDVVTVCAVAASAAVFFCRALEIWELVGVLLP